MKYPHAIISNKFFSQLVVVAFKVEAVVNIVVVIVVVVEVVLIFNI